MNAEAAGDAAAGLSPWPHALGSSAVTLAMQILFVIAVTAAAAAVALLLIRRPRTEDLVARPWTDRDLARLTTILLALAVVSALAVPRAEAWGTEWWSPNEWRAIMMSVQSLAFHWPILAFAASRMRREQIRSSEAFGMRARALPADVLLAFGLYLAGLPLVAAAAWGSRAILRWAGREPIVQPMLEAVLDANAGIARAYLLFLAVVAAPVAEEILFRGIALPVLTRRLGPWAALGATSLVFSAIHFDLTAAPPLFVLGLAFGLAYLYTGSLTVPIAMHAFVNAVSLAVAGWLAR